MVTVLMPGQSDETACVRISAALSEVTKQKLGFGVSIEQVAPTNYSAELWKRMVCQTMPDLFFLTENQPLDVYLNQNCILPLSALLEEYPGLKALFSEQQWASRTYYRRIYAIPARAVSMYQIGFLARADWMRELDARPEEITNLDALHDLLMQVRQRRPNAEGVLPDNGQVFPFPELDPLGDTFGVLTEESGTTVVNWYAADAYSRLCKTMHQWYQEGLILRNASLRDEPATDRMRLCNSFGFFARLNRDSLDCYTRACGTELTAIPLGPTIQNGSIPAESWCLPVTNSHRREALALLELLYTDASCYDLFANGDGKEGAVPSVAESVSQRQRTAAGNRRAAAVGLSGLWVQLQQQCSCRKAGCLPGTEEQLSQWADVRLSGFGRGTPGVFGKTGTGRNTGDPSGKTKRIG